MTSGVGQISYTTRRDAKTKLLKNGAPGMLPRHKKILNSAWLWQVEGITIEVLTAALAAAREARRHILDEMDRCNPAPARCLAPNAPRIRRFTVNPEKLGQLIGPGGRYIRGLIEESGADDVKVPFFLLFCG